MIKSEIFYIENVLLDFNPKSYDASKIDSKKTKGIYMNIFQSEEGAILNRGNINKYENKKYFH
ncbi:hypothetical protein CLPUN_34300 [Clostridium puniceum]|uniref:Uncharacterized protein n=1 Tax=Clostridium puniceum TaxID=29367 RepID=A0A1S8TC54_9CLOT|nr:hypothetical protein [Clostridium puniceum]OOM75189.1 hypothetical protein CLPUN_34300 [Clostridium puniceum]